MKQETKLRILIKDAEKIQDKSNDVGDQIIASMLLRDLFEKLLNLKYPRPKEL